MICGRPNPFQPGKKCLMEKGHPGYRHSSKPPEEKSAGQTPPKTETIDPQSDQNTE